MENASKALVIAGGILIALMILASFMFLFNQMSENANLQDEQQKAEEIVEFNSPYEVYQRNLLRGYDIVTVSNKANDYNINYRNKTEETDINQEIHIYVTFKLDDWEEFRKNTSYDLTAYFKDLRKNNKEKFDIFEEKYFKCTKMEYNNITGKIKALYFEEQDGIALLEKD